MQIFPNCRCIELISCSVTSNEWGTLSKYHSFSPCGPSSQDKSPQKYWIFYFDLESSDCHILSTQYEHMIQLYCFLLAPKELYTWYCPMTIRAHPLFEHTPVLDNNLNINAMMTLVTLITMMNKIAKDHTKYQMTQNVKWHRMSNDMKCQMTQNVKLHNCNYTEWCMMHDDGSMTPSRNDRRFTLWSVQSSPGRSFFTMAIFTLMCFMLSLSFLTGPSH